MARIEKITIESYRSIGDRIEIAVPLGRPLVLVGENNAGKSNIVKALELVLGPFWPGNHEPDEHEFHKRNPDGQITIEIDFAKDGLFGDRFSRVSWIYNKNRERPVFFEGHTNDGPSKYIRSQDRDSCICLTLEAERNLRYHLSYSSKWTYLSRLMHRFHRSLQNHTDTKERLEALFLSIKEQFEMIPEFAQFREELQSQLADLIGSMTHRLEVDFQAYNPTNFFHALGLQALEEDEPRALEEMGTGETQILALSFAYAYARAFHGGILLVVEEPEAHLHPLAQVWLARRLRSMAEGGLQVILTTHSPYFVNLLGLDGIALVSKTNRETRIKQVKKEQLLEYCIRTGVPEGRITIENILPFYHSNASRELLEGFFAKSIVLVEGPTESYAIPTYLRKCGLDTVKEGIAFLSVGGKGNIAKWHRLFTAYNIPCYVAFDNDASDDRDSAKRADALVALGVPSENHPQYLNSHEWIITDEYMVFGQDFERSLSATFPNYAELATAALNAGVGTKQHVARWIAARIEYDPEAEGWRKMQTLANTLRRKFGLPDPVEPVVEDRQP